MTININGCCNTWNFEFDNLVSKKLHYKSEWHCHNLKLKVDGFGAVSEDDFAARQSALVLAAEENKENETRMLYSCVLCCKGYRSPKAYAQHLTSKAHLARASNSENPRSEDAIVRPLLPRTETVDTDLEDDFDPTCCVMGELKNPTLDACVLHMHKKHGFLIQDIEYLRHTEGLLTYLGLQVTQDFMCLYCSERCHPFSSLEAVRKHMEAKGHFRVRFDDRFELEQFYDFTTRDMAKDGKQMVALTCDAENSVEFGLGGFELILKGIGTGTAEDVGSAKTLGCREFARYYKQQYPRFEFTNTQPRKMDLSSRINTEIKGLSKMQAKKVPALQMKSWKYQQRSGKDAVKLIYTLYSNKLYHLPRNCYR